MNDLYSMSPSQIVVYSTAYCPDCHRAKSYFKANNIPYLNVSLEDNQEATEFVISVNHGNASVPTIIFPDGSVLVEPSFAELNQKFAKK